MHQYTKRICLSILDTNPAPSDCLLLGAAYKCTYLLTYKITCTTCILLPFQTHDLTRPAENKRVGPITDPTQPNLRVNPPTDNSVQ